MSNAYDSVEEQRIDLDSNDDPITQTSETGKKKTKIYKPRSKVWQDFEKFTDKYGVSRAKCIHCSSIYKCDSKSQGTSNLTQHLKRCATYLDKMNGGQTQIAFSGDESRITGFDQKAIRKALAQMIVMDEMPFSVAQAYEKTFSRYDLEESDFRSDLENAGYEILTSTDWENVRYLCHFLKPFHDVTLRVSGTQYVTSNSCIEEIYYIRSVLDDAISDPYLCVVAMAMKAKFDKYFGNLAKMNLLLYFALILDPRNKEAYLDLLFEDRYEKKVASARKKIIMDALFELYNDYLRIHSPCSTTFESSSATVLGKRQHSNDMTPKPQFRNKLREKMKTQRVESVGELEKYLNENVEEDSSIFNILEWWKVNSPRFPIISLMAKDLFAIPVSTVASESVFSTSGRVLDPFKSSLTPRIVESLICTQDWLRDSSGSSNKLISEEDWETIQEIDKELDKDEHI